jgi:hypothetical protein
MSKLFYIFNFWFEIYTGLLIKIVNFVYNPLMNVLF